MAGRVGPLEGQVAEGALTGPGAGGRVRGRVRPGARLDRLHVARGSGSSHDLGPSRGAGTSGIILGFRSSRAARAPAWRMASQRRHPRSPQPQRPGLAARSRSV